MLGSRTDFSTNASAAKCMTASMGAAEKARSSPGASSRSHWKNWASGGSAARWPSTRLSTTTSLCPCRTRTSAQTLPTYPAPPVNKTFMLQLQTASPATSHKQYTRRKDLHGRQMHWIQITPVKVNARIEKLCRNFTLLVAKKDQVRAAANTILAEQLRDVKFYGALGDIQFIGDFLVGDIFEQGIEHLAFAAAQLGLAFDLHAPTRMVGEDGVYKT